jgi:hypothetical protein
MSSQVVAGGKDEIEVIVVSFYAGKEVAAGTRGGIVTPRSI